MDNNQQIQIPAEVRTFLEGLLEDSNMTALTDDMKEQMINELYERLDKLITATIVNNLPPEHLDTFIKLNEEKKSQSEIEQFLVDKLPNAQELFAKAFMDFRDLYLGKIEKEENSAENGKETPTSESNNNLN